MNYIAAFISALAGLWFLIILANGTWNDFQIAMLLLLIESCIGFAYALGLVETQTKDFYD